MDEFMRAAIEEAKQGLAEGGIPIGAVLYKIPKIVIGENKTFQGPEEYVHARGVALLSCWPG